MLVGYWSQYSACGDFCRPAEEVFGIDANSAGVLEIGDFNLPYTDWPTPHRAAADDLRRIMDLADFY